MEKNFPHCLAAFIIFIFVPFLSSCVTTTRAIGQAATKNFETRNVDASFDAVFSGATEALFDLGYTIKHSEKQSGIIVGEKQDAKKDDRVAMAILFGFAAADFVKPTVYNLTIMVKSIDEKSTNVRIKTSIDGEPVLNKSAIDKVWLYIDRQVLMESPPEIKRTTQSSGEEI